MKQVLEDLFISSASCSSQGPVAAKHVSFLHALVRGMGTSWISIAGFGIHTSIRALIQAALRSLMASTGARLKLLIGKMFARV